MVGTMYAFVSAHKPRMGRSTSGLHYDIHYRKSLDLGLDMGHPLHYHASAHNREKESIVDEVIEWMKNHDCVLVPLFDQTVPREVQKMVAKGFDDYNQRLLTKLCTKSTATVPEDENPDDYEVFGQGLLDIIREE